MRFDFKIVDSHLPQPQFDAILVSANDDPDHLRRQCTRPTLKEVLRSLLKAEDRNGTEAQNRERLKEFEITYRVLDDVRPIDVTACAEIHEKLARPRICTTAKLAFKRLRVRA